MDVNESIVEAPKLTDWSKEPTVVTLKQDLDASKPSHDAMVSKINFWLDYLNVTGAAKPKTMKNRSKVQPKLVRKQAEWRYSALSESFLSSEKLFNISPTTFEDQEAAEQNELVLNWQFRTKISRVKLINNYVRTVVNEGTAFIKVAWKQTTKIIEVEDPVYEFIAIQDQQQMEMFESALMLRDENPNEYLNLPAEAQASVDFYDETGQAALAVPTGEFTKRKEEKILSNHPTVDILNYNNVFIDPSALGDIDKAKFAVTSFETCHADLKADGRYKNLDKINWDSNSPLSTPDHVTKTPNEFNFTDKARKIVVAYEYWGYYDIEGKGELEPIVATWIGNVMIRMERSPYPDGRLPFVLVQYMPLKDSTHGETDAELLSDNQDIVGGITRGMLDMLARTANGQRGYARGMFDVTNRRKFEEGADYEYNPTQHPQQGIVTEKYGDIPLSALNMLTLQAQEAESMTGVKAFTGGMSGEAYGKVAAGIRGMLDAASKREMDILRRLAEGMEQIGRKIIAMNQEFLTEEEVVRVTNTQFVTVRREDLAGEFDLEVDISTPEVDEAKAQDLNFMLQTNGNNMDHGMRTILLSEIAILKRMPKLAKQIRDYQPQPDPMQVKIQELEIQKLELENQKLQMEMMEIQSRVPEIQSKAQLNMAKAREIRSTADLKDLDFVETETGTKHAREMQKTSAQARANQDLAVTKALLLPKKEGEKEGNITAAVGYNRLSDMNNEVK